jgi:hydrogenase nickel incorporation protein HypA/HybF
LGLESLFTPERKNHKGRSPKIVIAVHELSLVLSIVDIANEQLQLNNAREIESIDLEIGSLAGVEMDALLFAWDAAVPGTALEKSERIIHLLPALARCMDCGMEYEIAQLFEACPGCGQYRSELLQGKELRVKSLVVT